MSDRDDIRTLLAEQPEKVFSRIEVITALAHITPANIDTGLSWLVKNKQAIRVKHGHYRHNPDAVIRAQGGQPRPPQEKPAAVVVPKPVAPPKAKPEPPAWLADNLAPFQRVRLFIEANGPTKRQTLATMLANFGTDSLKRIASMCTEGVIHANADDLIALGPHPKASQARKHWDPRRDRPLSPPSNTTKPGASAPPQQAESPAQEISSAPATEYTKGERRTGDSDTDVQTAAPAELLKPNSRECASSAKPSESPASGIGQAPAKNAFEDLSDFDPAAVIKARSQPENTMSATVTQLHAQPEAAQQASQAKVVDEIADGVEKDVMDFGNGGGGVMQDGPMVVFSLLTEELEIEIAGDDERALTAIRAVLASLPLSKQERLS